MKRTLLALVAVACVVPALAFAAADPKPDSHFAYCTGSGDNLKCPLTFETNKAGNKIKELKIYDKCSGIPIKSKTGSFPPVDVDNGRFSDEGTVENFVGEKIKYKISGKFKRPKKAVGEYRLTTKDCNDKVQEFVAKRDGPAQPGV
jgi:hypothetical protein